MSALSRLASWFDRLMALMAGLCCVCMLAVVLASSFSRYFFNSPFQWSEEAARYAMIYGTVFGAVLAYNRCEHMRFSILVDLLGGPWGARLSTLVDIAALATGAIFAWSGYLFMLQRGGIVSPGLGLRMYYPNAAMMTGGVCLVIAAGLGLFGGRGTRVPIVGDAR